MGHAFVAMFNKGGSQSQRKLADLERFSDPEEKQRAAGEGSWILQKTLPNPRECSRVMRNMGHGKCICVFIILSRSVYFLGYQVQSKGVLESCAKSVYLVSFSCAPEE